MTETPEKIKRGMEHCAEIGCKDCPYEEDCKMFDRFSIPAEDAYFYIQQLEQDNAQKDERIRELEREREALLKIAIKDCFFCKHFSNENADAHCVNCKTMDTLWEWRGVEEDDNEA